jgi:hypothetical protein
MYQLDNRPERDLLLNGTASARNEVVSRTALSVSALVTRTTAAARMPTPSSRSARSRYVWMVRGEEPRRAAIGLVRASAMRATTPGSLRERPERRSTAARQPGRSSANGRSEVVPGTSRESTSAAVPTSCKLARRVVARLGSTAGPAGLPQRWVARSYQRQSLCRGLVQPESHAKRPGDSDLRLDAPTDGGAWGRRAGKLTGGSR